MKFSLFEQIYAEDIKEERFEALSEKYKVPVETIKGIYARKMHYQLMAALSALHKYPSNHLSSLFLKETSSSSPSSKSISQILKSLCKQFKLPPCVLVRILLKSLHPQLNPTLVLKMETEHLHALPPMLREAVEWAVSRDVTNSPAMDVVRNELGRAYEERIRTWLMLHSIPFYEESQERAKGVPKTPDFRLHLPIAIQTNSNNNSCIGDWKVITWIESKAMFGDPKTDAGYHKDQFRPYWNRFGPGLVIYWFDYVEEDDSSSSSSLIEEEQRELVYKTNALPIRVEKIK